VGEVLVEADINENVIKRHFENDFFYVKIVNDSRFKLNISDYAHEESLKGEFVRLIATDKELSNKDKMQIINIGIKALTNDLGKQDYEIN
jgi:glycine cleavage system H lipoate-binding protein